MYGEESIHRKGIKTLRYGDNIIIEIWVKNISLNSKQRGLATNKIADGIPKNATTTLLLYYYLLSWEISRETEEAMIVLISYKEFFLKLHLGNVTSVQYEC